MISNNFNNNNFKIFEQDIPDFTKEEAIEAGKRCLNCKRPFCKEGCPINNNIPEFIQAMLKDDMKLAYELLSEKTNLPAICGKICPHEKQCQGSCVLNRRNAPVQIGQIENYIANYAHENNIVEDMVEDISNKLNNNKLNNNNKIGIIGSGPAGLSCAYMLIKDGFKVDVYEEDKEAGGILAYGIPQYRLSGNIIKREIEILKKLGVKFICNTKIGDKIKLKELLDNNKYNAICVATGANNKKLIDIKGKDLDGVIHANKFLKDFAKYLNNEISREEVGIAEDDIVVIIGGGNVAMDASRTAKRLAKKTTVMYRRSVEEMPASKTEYNEALKDGVPFKWRHLSLELIGENGAVTGVRCKNIEDNIEFIEPCTKVLPAVGANPSICDNNINLNKWGYIQTTEDVSGLNGSTNIDGVFSAGDVVNGGTVVLAMREGRKVAESIKKYLNK